MDARLRDLKYKSRLDDILRRWFESNSTDEAQEVGSEFEKFRAYLPEEYLKSPSNTLYRCIRVKRSLLEKHKPLTLENRAYSSWTYSPTAAKKFGDSKYASKDYPLVILKRRFSQNEIFLNAEKLSAELLYGYMEDEKEIIVKNIKKNFTFQPNEIYLIKQEDNGPWMLPFEVLSSTFGHITAALKCCKQEALIHRIAAILADDCSKEESSTTETTAYFNYYYWNPAHPGDVGPMLPQTRGLDT